MLIDVQFGDSTFLWACINGHLNIAVWLKGLGVNTKHANNVRSGDLIILVASSNYVRLLLVVSVCYVNVPRRVETMRLFKRAEVVILR